MNKLRIYDNKKFSDLTTFRIGGPIKYYAEVKNKDEVCEAVAFAKENKLKIFILGGGSDFLASDADFDGLVVKYIGSGFKMAGDSITAEAGMEWDKLVEEIVNKNLQGVECLSGIPGTVGAAPIQNIGAYGQELKDTFVNLTAYDIDKGKFVIFDKNDCKFGYRESIFKEKSHWQKYIITDITLKLKSNAKPGVIYESLRATINENSSLAEIRAAVLKVRSEKLEDPKVIGNAGSFFKNPVIDSDKKEHLEKDYPDLKVFPFNGKFKISAAWLIEEAGWKGKSLGMAAISPKHSLILINPGNNANASDILKLSEAVISDVEDKFGVKLEREVQLINF